MFTIRASAACGAVRSFWLDNIITVYYWDTGNAYMHMKSHLISIASHKKIFSLYLGLMYGCLNCTDRTGLVFVLRHSKLASVVMYSYFLGHVGRVTLQNIQHCGAWASWDCLYTSTLLIQVL